MKVEQRADGTIRASGRIRARDVLVLVSCIPFGGLFLAGAWAFWPASDSVEGWVIALCLGIGAVVVIAGACAALLRSEIVADAGRRSLSITLRMAGVPLLRRDVDLFDVREFRLRYLEGAAADGPFRSSPELWLVLASGKKRKLRMSIDADGVERGLNELAGLLHVPVDAQSYGMLGRRD